MFKLNFLKLLIIIFLSFTNTFARSENHTDNKEKIFRFDGFVNQYGKLITPSDLNGKLVFVNFIFTGCSATCPIQTSELVKFQRQLPHDLLDKIYFISISVDPLRDTSEKLLAYAKKHHVNLKNWAFIKGDPAAFERIRNEFVAIKPTSKDGEKEDFNLHTTDLSLFDIDGRFIQRYRTNPIIKNRLLEDIKAVINLHKKEKNQR